MLIPIPVATRWVATARGTVWKVVTCSHCQQRYAFQLELETTGQEVGPPLSVGDEGAKLAQARAEENLSKMARNVVIPLPCPICGCYQPDMVDRLRTEGTGNTPVIAGMVVAVLSLIPLAFRVPYIWVATAVGVSVGLGLIGYADWAAARWDPNAGDPEPRKARGRKRAVWGEQLERLLATGLDAGPTPVTRAVGGPAADDQFRFKLWEGDGPAVRVVGGPAADAEPLSWPTDLNKNENPGSG
jgi:hypothetical protein